MTQNCIDTTVRLLQVVSATTTSVITGSTAIPIDNTIPQNNEGNEALTCSITPKSASSTLLIEYTGQSIPNGTTASGALALFQDSTANALAAVFARGGTCEDISLRFVMTSGTTSATTFKVRVGKEAGTALYVNADTSGNPLMGGVMNARLVIFEYL